MRNTVENQRRYRERRKKRDELLAQMMSELTILDEFVLRGKLPADIKERCQRINAIRRVITGLNQGDAPNAN